MVLAAALTDVVQALSVGVGGGPAEAGELARDRDRDDRAALAALAVESAPCAVQALLCLPADRDDVRGLPGLAALECLALRRCSAGEIGALARCPCGSFSSVPSPEPGVTVSDHRALQQLFRD
jgi:hypothetical protein